MSNMDLSPISREPMRLPPPLRLVAGSIIVAFLINLLPWSGWALRVHPDFVLLALLYWAVHERHTMSQTWGFFLGLIMDVADSSLLGQYALIYVTAIFLAQMLRLRLIQLTLFEQALHIAAILFASKLLSILLNLSMGRDFPGISLLIAPLLGAALWPLVYGLLNLTRFSRPFSPSFGPYFSPSSSRSSRSPFSKNVE